MRHYSIFAAIFAAIALLTPTISYAADHAVVEPELTRYELVFQVAEKACPAAKIAHTRKVMDAAEFMTKVGNRADFTTDEQILLKNYCLMWIQGVTDSQ